ncbi:MAG: hypothetical protein QM667_09620, partial [Asticcacaulis sp.]
TVQLRFVLEKEGTTMSAYTQTLKFDADGVAYLRLWSRMLTLRLVGERVSAEWSQPADIRSPAYQLR